MVKASVRELYSHSELVRLIDPKVVAVVGASETPGSFGQRTLANMSEFAGKVYAVNPKYRNLFDRPCVPSLGDLPEAPDCVILCVARPMVEGMVKAAGAVGAGGAIVYASGFSETGKPERVEEQERIVAAARRLGVRIAGPNCVGLANTQTRAGLNFMPDYGRMGHRRGPVAIVSQSGALGYTVLQGMQRGIGFSKYLAAGNSSDVDVCDFISFLADDEQTRAIVCLFEGVKDGARFLAAARKARDAGKALVVYKAGASEASRKAALSHTGTMVGSYQAYAAAFEEVGSVATDNLESVLELASLFAKSGAPTRGRGVGVLATSGGAAVICADKAERHGVPLPALAAKTAEALNKVVPDFGSVANPSDLTAEVLKTSETFGYCLDAFLTDPSFSALVMPMVFAHASSSGARAAAVVQAAKRTDKPLAVIWMNEWLQGPGSEVFDADPRVSTFRSVDRCFAALRAWSDWHEFGRHQPSASRRSAMRAAAAARKIIARGASSGTALSETESKAVLAAYGVRVPDEAIASDPDAAAAAAKRIGFPVALKISSKDILHKTEVGGIRLGVSSEEAARVATREILASSRKHKPEARIDGVSVQQMLTGGGEIVIGVKRDPQFGPLIAVGMGGVLVELLQDAAVRLAPVSDRSARAMVESLKGYKLLKGYRGVEGVDLNSLVDVICRVSELADDLKDLIEEIDVNPVIVSATGAVAADALVVTQS
ncbi:acetate--CoA ligase family protein [Roseiarcus sp.]|jgi:acyl-CoA synthetase (NDP forming)|uniref:acetate--CoA ligase family protein n=1 Tax=Roseiarcus sp. TaxID=1969460 RepID=UPI003D14B61E